MNILLRLCFVTEALGESPCSSPQCPTRATVGFEEGHHFEDPSQNYPPHGCNQLVPLGGGALFELGDTRNPP